MAFLGNVGGGLRQISLDGSDAGESEDGETENIGHEAEDHGSTSPAEIGYTSGGDFHEVDHDLAEGDEYPNCKIGKPHLPESEYQKIIIILLIF